MFAKNNQVDIRYEALQMQRETCHSTMKIASFQRKIPILMAFFQDFLILF